MEGICEDVTKKSVEDHPAFYLPKMEGICEDETKKSVEDHPNTSLLKEFESTGRSFLKRRRSEPTYTVEVSVNSLSDDGFSWRKYGQKAILGARYPRNYYRCTYLNTRGCVATKQMQRLDEDSSKFEIIYRGDHTCQSKTMPMITLGSASVVSDKQSSMDEQSMPPSFCRSEISNVVPNENETNIKSSEFRYAVTGLKQEFVMSPHSSITSLTETHQCEIADMWLNDRMSDEDESCCLENSWPPSEPSVPINGNFQRLLSAFQDVEVKKIGIYGDGGIGKTTVMKSILFSNEYNILFDLVLWVSISKHSSRRNIQNAILQQLSLNVASMESDDEVATILYRTLLARKFVLLLDDVREHVDLLKVGVPTSFNTDFKIVLTTRSFDICESMGMDKIIEAEVLSKEQSLELFLSNVGHVMDSQHIELYGRAIVDECAGLPLTIKVVGKALRTNSSILVWKCALKELLMSNNLQVLKLGYDTLEEHDMRSCFLFSALFTESKAIRVSSLVEYLIDDGFIVGSKSHAHNRGYDIVKHLIDVSLLECTDDGLMVEMHDVIRDLALMILSDAKGVQMLLSRYSMSVLLSQEAFLSDMRNPAFGGTEQTETAKLSSSGDPHCVLKGGDGLEEPPPEEELEEAKMVFLMDNNLTSLPSEPNCSKLQILFLQRNENLRTIPSSFFENMSSLQILNLSKTRIKDLPQSLSKLQILQVLILRNCERLLFLPSAIGDLKQLLVLDVHGTEICQLPDEIGELLSLVNLQLCFYGSMDEDECDMLPSQLISKGVISKFSGLRELSIIVYPGDPRWTKIASDATIEVSNLELCSLSFHFPEVQHFVYFINASPAWLHRTLTRFNFIVGHDVKRIVSHVCDDLEHEYSSQDRCLRFVDGEDIPDAINEALYQATAFYLDHHQTAHSLTQFAWAAIKGLKFCIVKDCPKLKAIINSRKSTEHYFPVLELLSIHYSWKLSQIWVGPIRAGSLSMLRKLSLHSCPILEVILSPHMVAVLSNLEELIVVDCQSLKNVVSNQEQKSADEDVGDSDISEPNVSDLNSMQDNAEDVMEIDLPKAALLRIKVLKLHHLPDLVNIWSGGDLPCLEYVSVYHCPRLRNLNLKSHVEVTIKEIKTETDWWDNLEWENPALRAKLQDRVKEIQCDDI